MHNNFVVSKPNTIIFVKFFENFIQIIATAKLYLENDIENSSMIIDDGNDATKKNNIEEDMRRGLYVSFDEFKNIQMNLIMLLYVAIIL